MGGLISHGAAAAAAESDNADANDAAKINLFGGYLFTTFTERDRKRLGTDANKLGLAITRMQARSNDIL
ncbi:MAG: hypothetical protein Hyperionvirus1_85 [Hyperionvirus sp.]|uniref:Uncharacterized protein n=1 Tax=Hyperionvirus sp. TaxID=2487770 RepID=A0A3G5A5I9_9VIRU|nr:MAG: hypothetical protein Hyperionvirus1_85 [Hyperionvirus sp.]